MFIIFRPGCFVLLRHILVLPLCVVVAKPVWRVCLVLIVNVGGRVERKLTHCLCSVKVQHNRIAAGVRMTRSALTLVMMRTAAGGPLNASATPARSPSSLQIRLRQRADPRGCSGGVLNAGLRRITAIACGSLASNIAIAALTSAAIHCLGCPRSATPACNRGCPATRRVARWSRRLVWTERLAALVP